MVARSMPIAAARHPGAEGDIVGMRRCLKQSVVLLWVTLEGFPVHRPASRILLARHSEVWTVPAIVLLR